MRRNEIIEQINPNVVDGPLNDERTDRIRHVLYEIEWNPEKSSLRSCEVKRNGIATSIRLCHFTSEFNRKEHDCDRVAQELTVYRVQNDARILGSQLKYRIGTPNVTTVRTASSR